LKILRQEISTGSDKNLNIDGTIQTLVTLENIKTFLKVNLQEDSNDNLFKKEYIRTTVDAIKVFKGALTNPIVKLVMDSLSKMLQLPPKFPYPPVNH
jgi:hypothetical protein